jgi:hypothetical protein
MGTFLDLSLNKFLFYIYAQDKFKKRKILDLVESVIGIDHRLDELSHNIWAVFFLFNAFLSRNKKNTI